MDMIPNRSKLQSALTDAHEFIIWSILGNNKKKQQKKNFYQYSRNRGKYIRGEEQFWRF